MAEDLRICVTGLSRAGKTAFITALADALRHAQRAPQNFPAWPAVAQGRWRGAKVRPPGGALSALEAFPFEANRRALTAVPPAWPHGTEAVRALTLECAFVPEPGLLGDAWRWTNRHLGRRIGDDTAQITITLVDYPGEWALDLPLREMDFAAWSETTLARIAQEPRAAIAGPFLDALAALDPFAPHDERLARRAQRAYLALLERCRDELRLSFLQPGLFLRPEKIGGREALLANDAFLFTPLPLPPGATARDAPKGSTWRSFTDRFDAYRRDQVEAFFTSLAGPCACTSRPNLWRRCRRASAGMIRTSPPWWTGWRRASRGRACSG